MSGVWCLERGQHADRANSLVLLSLHSHEISWLTLIIKSLSAFSCKFTITASSVSLSDSTQGLGLGQSSL